MTGSLKSVFFLLFILALITVCSTEVNAQNGRSGRGEGIEKNVDGAAGTGTPDVGEDDEFTDDDFEDEVQSDEEFENDPPAVKEKVKAKETTKKISDNKDKSGISSLSRETLLEKETQRHKNQMKQVNAVRKRAKEMLKKADDMEAKELKRHDESVQEIKNN
ncbi:MAG TPA: hypothetical protein PKW56_06950 [Clostridiales bacterium]|nr:hypothetical protein [Clostridiales bacterium]